MNKFYVYIWYNDDWGGVPIYIGKGSGDRYSSREGRSVAFTNHVKRWKCHSEIVFDELDEVSAMRMEKKLKVGFIMEGYPILDAEVAYRRKCSQAEGIAAMPIVNGKKVSLKTGRTYGRQPVELTDDFEKFVKKQKDGSMTVKECCKALGISRATWYNRVAEVN